MAITPRTSLRTNMTYLTDRLPLIIVDCWELPGGPRSKFAEDGYRGCVYVVTRPGELPSYFAADSVTKYADDSTPDLRRDGFTAYAPLGHQFMALDPDGRIAQLYA